jgi:hypothetical protein
MTTRLVPRIGVLLLTAALACSLSGPDEEGGSLARLVEARQRWEASGIAQYELRLRRTCGECLPASALSVVVSVSGGEKTVSLAENGEPVEAPHLYPDVDGLLHLIEEMVLAGAEVEAEYDARGVPRSVAVDPVPDAVDDEFGYVIEGLVIGRLADLRAELSVQRERWMAQHIDDYQLTLSRSCFCAPEGAGLVVVTVLGGEPVAWLYFLSGDPVDAAWQPVFPTVDGVFDFLEEAIARGADAIEVTFDPVLGLPTSLHVDYRAGLADEEIGYELEKLVPILDGVPPEF